MPGYQYGATLPSAFRHRITSLQAEVARLRGAVRCLDGEVRELKNENARLRGVKAADRPIDHGTPSGYSRHYDRGEKPCEDCRTAYLARRRGRYQNRKKDPK